MKYKQVIILCQIIFSSVSKIYDFQKGSSRGKECKSLKANSLGQSINPEYLYYVEKRSLAYSTIQYNGSYLQSAKLRCHCILFSVLKGRSYSIEIYLKEKKMFKRIFFSNAFESWFTNIPCTILYKGVKGKLLYVNLVFQIQLI